MEFSCGAVAGLSVSVSVARWTSHYPELSAVAERLQRQWAQSDARAPFVAWDADDPRIPERLRAWRVGSSGHEIAHV